MDAEFIVDAYIENNAVSGLELESLRGENIRFLDFETA
jgi:hypothetical protein